MQISKTDYGFHVSFPKPVTVWDCYFVATRIFKLHGRHVNSWRVETDYTEIFLFDPDLNETYLDHEPLS